MKLSSGQLEAFFEVAQTLSFSKAAKNLRITQSALSQRILNLESELARTLLIREPSGARLTEAGEILLRHCQIQNGLEMEVLSRLKGERHRGLGGNLRIAGFSSVMRSVILPALSPLVRANPDVQVEFMVREIRELPALLRTGEADFVILDHSLERAGVEVRLMGYEENVLVRPAAKADSPRDDIFLDHDLDDVTTQNFLAAQGKKAPPFKRSFLDDIYGIIDGVALGWGAAVVPKHLVKDRSDLKIDTAFKAQRSPVYLHFYAQPYYPELHHKIVAALGRAHLLVAPAR